MTATIFGGCMRFYPDSHATPGPRWHVDADHHTEGIDATVAPYIDTSGFICFEMLEKNPIITGTIMIDESIGKKSIRAGGPSNGTKLVRFRLFRPNPAGGDDIPLDLNLAADRARVAGSTNNFWVTIVHDVPPVEEVTP